jgi:hypothetical protein
MKNQILTQNGNFKNPELVKAMFYGYVRGQFMNRLELFEQCIYEDDSFDIDIVPKSITNQRGIGTNFALAKIKYRTQYGNEVQQLKECFYQELNDLKWIDRILDKQLDKIAVDALNDSHDMFVGFTKPADKKAQKWYFNYLKNQDDLIAEANNLIK